MSELHFLDDGDGVGAEDRPWVCAWDLGGGISIEAPGCGTADLSDAEAIKLLNWLSKRYPLDRLADV